MSSSRSRRGGDLAHPSRAASQPDVRTVRTSTVAVARPENRPGRPLACGGRDRELELTRKEFDLLARLAARRRPRGLARDADVRGLGRELVRLDEDARRPHRRRCGASSATTRPARATSRPCGASASAASPRGAGAVASAAPRTRPAGRARLRTAAGDRRAGRAARPQPAAHVSTTRCARRRRARPTS